MLKQALKLLGLHVAANDVAGFWREPALRIVERFFGVLVANESVQQCLCLLLALGKSVAEFVLHKLRLLRVSQINVAVAQTRKPDKRPHVFVDDAGVNCFVNRALAQHRFLRFQRSSFFIRQVTAHALAVHCVRYAPCRAGCTADGYLAVQHFGCRCFFRGRSFTQRIRILLGRQFKRLAQLALV